MIQIIRIKTDIAGVVVLIWIEPGSRIGNFLIKPLFAIPPGVSIAEVIAELFRPVMAPWRGPWVPGPRAWCCAPCVTCGPETLLAISLAAYAGNAVAASKAPAMANFVVRFMLVFTLC